MGKSWGRGSWATGLALMMVVAGRSAEAQTTVFVSALPDGEVRVPYAAQVATANATGWTFTLSAGALPPGLALTGQGELFGRPTEAGAFTFTVLGSSAVGFATETFTVVIRPFDRLQIVSDPLPLAVVSEDYAFMLEADGQPPYTWQLLDGPPWVSLSPSGALTASPPIAGSFQLSIRVQDAAGQTANGFFELLVSTGAPLSLVDVALPPAFVGVEYCSTRDPPRLLAAGGVPPYLWTVISPAPVVFIVGRQGSLCGVPRTAGPATVEFRVGDAIGDVVSGAVTITVLPSVGPQILTTSLPSARIGEPYAARLEATSAAGVSPDWRISEGRLPGGLVLAGDRIVGEPTEGGVFIFEVAASDPTGVSEQVLSIEVSRSPVVDPPPTPGNGGGELDDASDVGCVCAAGSKRAAPWAVLLFALAVALTTRRRLSK